MDGRKIPADADPRWFGYAVGHWDGNDLVIDSAAYGGENLARRRTASATPTAKTWSCRSAGSTRTR